VKPRRALALAAALAIAALRIPSATAAPTIWARARVPELEAREQLLASVEELELKYRRLIRLRPDQDGITVATMYLRQAKDILEQAGAARSSDVTLRFRLAELYHELKVDKKATPLLESIVRSNAPAPMRAEAWSDLAVSYARLDRHKDELKAYTQALALEPHSSARSTLLANRAEAYMFMGDITAAVEGYRASLSLLSPFEMFRFGSTTLWGLAVALDRSGDLDSAIEAIRLARSYDPLDKRLEGPFWFYSPPYDKHWYQALGFWSAARQADLGATRAEGYRRSIASWEQYIESAAADDTWLPLARARLKQCEKERERIRR